MISPPARAMVLAAGMGRRMRPLTAGAAKPLLVLAGRPLIDHVLARLAAAKVEKAVVNAYWQADTLAAHLARFEPPPEITVIREPELRGIGGAVAEVLHSGLFGPDPFYVVNGDAFWLDGPTNMLSRLARAFDPAAMDAILLLQRTTELRSETGPGDFFLDPLGRIACRSERRLAPYVYAGVMLAAPALLKEPPPAPFGMKLAWDRAVGAGRLFGIVHDGLWFHLSTPRDLDEAEAVLNTAETGHSR